MKRLENLGRDINTTKKDHMEWLEIIKKNLTQMKILFKRLNSTLDSTKGRIHELEHRTDKVSKLKYKGRCVEFGKKKQTRASKILWNSISLIRRRQNL